MSFARPTWRSVLSAVILLLVAALGVIAIVAYARRPPSQASALLLFDGTSPSLVGTVEFDQREYDRYCKTQAELIVSPAVLNPALQKIHSIPQIREHPDPIEYLQSILKVTRVGDSELFRVTATEHTDEPERLAQIVNEVMHEYLSFTHSDHARRHELFLRVLGEEVTRRKAILQKLQDELLGLQAEENPTDEQKHQLRWTERELSLEEEIYQKLARRKKTLQLDIRAPVRVKLLQAAQITDDNSQKYWWDWLLGW